MSKTGKKDKQKPATLGDWISGARLRTLSLAVAPVAVGAGAAVVLRAFNPLLSILALVVALALQIGVNYANDYSDGIRGVDDNRVGPARLTASGRVKPRSVLMVALVFFGIAAVVGVVAIVISGQYWLLAVGVLAIAAAWFYTGAPFPYGYYGLGEVFVFLFFGLAATVGTTWLQAGNAGLESWVGGAAVGALAAAVLVVNNLRDLEGDREAGKKTLTVLIGNWPSRILYCVLVVAAFVILGFFSLVYPLGIMVFFVLLAAVPAGVIAVFAKTKSEFDLVLKLTSLTALLFGLGLGAAFAF